MSVPEAKVYQELERRNIPFSWRFFDGDALNTQYLIPDWHPEFTLREYKICITVLGGFFGQLPGVLDRIALASVLLAEDGWKLAILYEQDINNGVAAALDKELPELVAPAIQGPLRPRPFGVPDYLEKLRQRMRGFALLNRYYIKRPDTENQKRGQISGGSYTRRKYIRRATHDSGRRRPRRPNNQYGRD